MVGGVAPLLVARRRRIQAPEGGREGEEEGIPADGRAAAPATTPPRVLPRLAAPLHSACAARVLSCLAEERKRELLPRYRRRPQPREAG
jgi:hypothetical protein